jgi:hypothetical protein
MIVDSANNISILSQEKPSIADFIGRIRDGYKGFKNDHLIINLLSLNSVRLEDVEEFLELSKDHRATEKSFVIVAMGLDYDGLPDELIVVPTIQEAYDMIEMESIERDLGL